MSQVTCSRRNSIPVCMVEEYGPGVCEVGNKIKLTQRKSENFTNDSKVGDIVI